MTVYDLTHYVAEPIQSMIELSHQDYIDTINEFWYRGYNAGMQEVKDFYVRHAKITSMNNYRYIASFKDKEQKIYTLDYYTDNFAKAFDLAVTYCRDHNSKFENSIRLVGLSEEIIDNC